MPAAEARALFDEMMLTAHAISSVVKPAKLNYACLGNIEPHVHWHIFPRQLTDPDPRSPVWARPETVQKSDLEPTDKSTLIRSLQAELKRSASSRG